MTLSQAPWPDDLQQFARETEGKRCEAFSTRIIPRSWCIVLLHTAYCLASPSRALTSTDCVLHGVLRGIRCSTYCTLLSFPSRAFTSTDCVLHGVLFLTRCSTLPHLQLGRLGTTRHPLVRTMLARLTVRTSKPASTCCLRVSMVVWWTVRRMMCGVYYLKDVVAVHLPLSTRGGGGA